MFKCRLCYTDPNPQLCQHIFKTKFKPPLWKIIKQLSNLIITKNDPYTKNICGPCFIKLVEYSAFRQTILDTNYRIQHAEELLSENIRDDCDYIEVHCTSSSSDTDDSIVIKEQIEIEDHPLEIDDEIKEEWNNSNVAVIDNQNIKELTILDGVNNNDKITACYTRLNDVSSGTKERQSTKSSTDDIIDFNRDSTETNGSYTISPSNNNLRLTDNDDVITGDGNEITKAKDVIGSSNSFDNNSSCTNSNNDNNGKKEEFNVEMSTNNRKKYNTRNSLRLNVDNSIDIKDKTTKKNSESTKRRNNARYDLNMNLKEHNRKTLQNHAEMQTDERPLKSKNCNKQSSDKANLCRYKEVQMDNKSYRCNICNKQFSYKTNLLRHERIHTGEKPFKCTICNKQFSDRSNLYVHQRLHTGEKPFKCTICNKQFSRKSHLRKHERIHTGEKPFKCNICGKSFTTRSHLKDHLNVHTGQKPYCCNICNKMFAFRSVLNRHLRLHRNGRVRV